MNCEQEGIARLALIAYIYPNQPSVKKIWVKNCIHEKTI